MNKVFNIVISGVGGQGLITLLNLLARASLDSGLDVKTSELHGLSQRGGSVEVYIRFGEKACPVRRNHSFCLTGVYSPLVSRGKADLVIALEQQEALNGAQFSSKGTAFLVNKYQTPTLKQDFEISEIEKELNKASKKVFIVSASEICQKELGNDVVAGIYLLGFAVKKNFLPLKAEIIKQAMRETMPEKFWELNIKAFELGFSAQ